MKICLCAVCHGDLCQYH